MTASIPSNPILPLSAILPLHDPAIHATICLMKKRTHYASCPQEYLTAFGLNPEKVIYFDIETTGFRASTSSLYMIGWAVRGDSFGMSKSRPGTDGRDLPQDGDCRWIVTQIMAQSRAEEVLLLEHFRDILTEYDTIVEFNGDRFDLPYMREKYAQYRMEDPLSRLRTVDLYQEIRPFKKALGLTRLNQKSVEQFLHILRRDPYNGGELIGVYRSVRDHCCMDPEGALDALFLHNYEDVLGMLDMTPLLAYRLVLINTEPVSVRIAVPDSPSVPDDPPDPFSPSPQGSSPVLEASFSLMAAVPRPLEYSPGEHCTLVLSGDLATVTIRPYAGSLYHFFPDWQNYYYLPAEDTAMHKSVASFVDPSHRQKANARNCYVKKEGIFLPCAGSGAGPDSRSKADTTPVSLTGEITGPLFRRSYKDPVLWFEYRRGMEEETGNITEYVHGLIRDLLS